MAPDKYISPTEQYNLSVYAQTMVQFKVMLNNPKGESLNKWIERNPGKLHNKRLLYILKNRADESVFKIGIAGELGNPVRRLREYELMYGKTDEPVRDASGTIAKENGKAKINPCSGADLYFLGTTHYNPKVEWRKTAVYQKELFMKRKLRTMPGYKSVARGPERVRATYQQLMKLVRDPNFLRLDEKPGYIRVSKRNPEQRVVQSQDTVVKVIGHRLGAPRQKTRYRVTWSRADAKGNADTDELASFIEKVPGGREQLRLYKRKVQRERKAKKQHDVQWKD